MDTVYVKRLSVATVFRLVGIAIMWTVPPLFVLDTLGVDIIQTDFTWNNEPVSGPALLIIEPLFGVVISALSALVLGVFMAVGLWLHSLVQPIRVDYVPHGDASSTAGSIPNTAAGQD